MILFLYIFIPLLMLIIGFVIGIKLPVQSYDGTMTLTETEQGLKYTLVLLSDPELLAFQEDVRFKVVAPDYEKLLRD